MTKPMKQVKTSFQIVKQNVSVSTVSLDAEKHKTLHIAKAKQLWPWPPIQNQSIWSKYDQLMRTKTLLVSDIRTQRTTYGAMWTGTQNKTYFSVYDTDNTMDTMFKNLWMGIQ